MDKKQILVHLHTSEGELSTIKDVIKRDVRLGEIIVRHANNKPELYTKKDDGSFATFIDSVAVDAKISAAQTTLQGSIDTLNTKVDNFSSATETALANVKTYTDGEVANAVASAQTLANKAKDDAYAAASAYTDGQVASLKTTLEGQIDTVENSVEALEGVVSAFSASVVENYATTAETETAIATAKGEAISAASAYTFDQVAAAKTELEGKISGATKELQGAIDGVAGDLAELSGSVETMKEDLEESIAAAVTKAYVYKGSVESYGDLPENAENGDVWNVATESVVDGKIYPAGTNWAWVASEEEGKSHWDALGGIVDLTPYATSADTHNAIAAVQAEVDALEANVETLSGNTHNAIEAAKTHAENKATEAKDAAISAASAYTFDQVAAAKTELEGKISGATKDLQGAIDGVAGDLNTFSGIVDTKFANYATAAETEAAIATAKGEAISAASAYTFDQVKVLSGSVVAEVSRLDGRVDSTNTRVAALEAISGATQTAVQAIEIAGIEGVKATASGTTWTIDFTEMVVDCGTF